MHVNGWDDYILKVIIKNQFEIEYDILTLHLVFEHELSKIYTKVLRDTYAHLYNKLYSVLCHVNANSVSLIITVQRTIIF